MRGFEMRDGMPQLPNPTKCAPELAAPALYVAVDTAKMLTPAGISSYKQNGFIVVKNAIPADEARQMGDEIEWLIDKIRNGENVQWGGTFLDKNDRRKQVINDLHDGQLYSQKIKDWLTDKRHLIPAAQLIGPEVALHHIKAVSKPGKTDGTVGGLFPLHQDHPFFKLRNEHVLAGLLSCTEGNEESGGLIGFPGSHKYGWLREDQEAHPDDPTKRQSHLDPKKWDPESAQRINTEPGDMVYFSVNFVHGSGINRTPRPRINLISQLMHPSNTFTAEEERTGKNPHKSVDQGLVLCTASDLEQWNIPVTKLGKKR